jgi:hypothetical protein
MIDPRRLKDLPVPPLPAGLGDRVLASRAAGIRTHLPVVDGNRRVRPGFLAAAAVLAIVLLAVVKAWSPRATTYQPSNSVLGDPFFFPQQAFAQQPVRSAPSFPLVQRADGSRLIEGTFRYWSQTPNIGREVRRTMSLRRAPPGQWVVAIETAGPYSLWHVDSAWLNGQTLQAIRQVRRRRHETLVQMLFRPDTIQGVLRRPRHKIDARGTHAIPPEARSLMLPSWDALRAVIGAMPLDRSWTGSLQVAWTVNQEGTPYLAPINLRVAGEGTVRVPAGEFDCWQVLVETPPGGWGTLTLWVSKREHWVVRSTWNTDTWPDEVLLSFEPRP